MSSRTAAPELGTPPQIFWTWRRRLQGWYEGASLCSEHMMSPFNHTHEHMMLMQQADP